MAGLAVLCINHAQGASLPVGSDGQMDVCPGAGRFCHQALHDCDVALVNLPLFERQAQAPLCIGMPGHEHQA
ncbi:hypothetical protein D3C72_2180700 [compost metagenome]